MARRRVNSSLGVSGRGRDPGLGVQVLVEGVSRTELDFKLARRDANTRFRDAIQRAGERTVLPKIQAEFPSGRFADTLFVRRDRTTVFIGSRERGKLNRTVGWLDFGGRRPRDSVRRTGPYVIVRTLERERDVIDDALREELPRVFHGFDVEVR